MTTHNHKAPLFLGIDGGGSKCRAILYRDGDGILGTGLSGAANPVNGLQAAKESILDACEQALRQAQLAPGELRNCIAGAGLAGVNLPSCMAAMEAWQHPFGQFHLTTDLHIACLGAHGRQDGAIIISGTGSCGFLSVGSHQRIYGGHGFPQGDKGSGAWFGLMALQHALQASDGLAEPTAIAGELAPLLGSHEPLEWVEQMAGQRSTAFARLAAVVFRAADKQDAVAQAILAEGAGYISELGQQLLDDGAPRLALLGGLGPLLTPHLSAPIQAAMTPAQAAPEMGAVYYAQDCLGAVPQAQAQ
ncbi:N-acetylglucosamine kinase [Ferrimonas marina]|uniref:Glucosamine kinase n=1 Tax=Ferrimonas marina TaxID=299255 RepID=A0A1M5YDV2_9GAMM|nr:BadF/BadG/BcrA/BcrD ATPase family protein [Ferrimonas marina]SHI09693.1 glucosamine kinase [Ferrimonas marina]